MHHSDWRCSLHADLTILGRLTLGTGASASSSHRGVSSPRLEICFTDDWQFASVPKDALLALADKLRTADNASRDPLTGEQIDAGGADVLADALEVAVETEAAQFGMDESDRPAFRWALQRWCEGRAEIPGWAKQLAAPN
jgi:hypothetical protein